MNSLFLGLATGFASCLTVKFLCKKLDIEKLINHKISIRISLFLIAVLLNIVGTSIIENFITREYQFLLKCFLTGATLYLIIFSLPVNNKKTKL
jgi:hypothetical protein